MSGEIFIDNGDHEMELDGNEQALLEEIEVGGTRSFQMGGDNRPSRHPQHRPEPTLDDPMAFMNPDKRQAPRPTVTTEAPADYGDDDMPEPMPSYAQAPDDGPSDGFNSIEDEKSDLLNKLTRLSQKKGIHVNKSLNMYSGIDEIRAELKRAKYSVDVDQSIKFSRRALIACITGLEFMNKRYDPFDLKLDGWSESIMENVEDYDEPFEELYVKYRSSVKMAPEIKLMMMVGGSGMMFHLTNSMFKSVMPNVNDVMRQNPGLMQNMMGAVQNTMQNPGGAPAPPMDMNAGGPQQGGRREMKGPGIDLSAMMGNMMMPQPPQAENTYTGDIGDSNMVPEDDELSDIVSIISTSDVGDLKSVNISGGAKKRRGRKKKSDKNEISI